MGKLTSYILGITVAMVLSYYVLSADYGAIINWLGPVTGAAIIFPFAFVYLLMGNFIANPILLLVWIVIGAVVGIGARKGTRAIGAAITVYFSLWAFLIGAFLALAQSLTGGFGIPGLGGSGTTATLPPLPPGVTLTAILSEPLVQPLVTLFTNLGGIIPGIGTTAPGTTPSITSVGGLVAGTFAPYIIANIIVFFVTAAVVGWFIHSMLYKKGKPSVPTDNGDVEKQPKRMFRSSRNVKKTSTFGGRQIMASLIVVAVILSSIGFIQAFEDYTSPASNSASTSNQNGYNTYNMTVSTSAMIMGSVTSNATPSSLNNTTSLNYGGGMVGNYGNIYNLYAFLNSSVQPGTGFLNTGASSGSLVTLLMIADNVPSLFRALTQDGIINVSVLNTLQSNQYYNLIPGAILLEIFAGDIANTSSQASQAAAETGTTMGSGAMNNFLSVSVPVTSQNNLSQFISIYAYSFSVPVQSAEEKLTQSASQYISNDGMFSAFSNGITGGHLIPGTSGGVNSSIFLAGKIDLTNLPSGFGGVNDIIPGFGNSSTGTGVIAFIGGLFVKESILHSSVTTHNITASQLFGYSGKVYFNSTDTAYAVSMTYPVASNTSAGNQYNTTIYTTVGNISLPGTAGFITYVYMPYGSFLDFSNVTITTNATFPADILVAQSISSVGGNTYNVTITMTNNDTDTLNSVNIYAGQILTHYGSSVQLVSGGLSSSATQLVPGASLTVKYSVKLSGIGTYILATPLFNYTSNNVSFSVIGNALTASAPYPSVIQTVHDSQLSTFTTISNVTHFPLLIQNLGGGFYFFDLLLLLIIALDIFIEYRAYSKWSRKRKQEPES